MAVKPLTVPFFAARWHGGTQTPKAIVVHGTVTPCARGVARAVGRDFQRTATKKSAHYIVDPGEIIQSVADHVVAFHCGFNNNSIAFELCDPQEGSGRRWSDRDHELMLDLAANGIARTCLAYKIEMRHVGVNELKAQGPHGIYDHNASRLAFGHTSHVDVGSAFPWNHFLDLIDHHAAEIAGGRQEPPMATPTQQTKAKILAAVQFGKAEIPKRREAQHALLKEIESKAKKLK